MTVSEYADLIDLYVDDALPAALYGLAESYLAARPDAAEEAEGLKATARRLQSTIPEKPDEWFIERTLNRLLHAHNAAQDSQLGRAMDTY